MTPDDCDLTPAQMRALHKTFPTLIDSRGEFILRAQAASPEEREQLRSVEDANSVKVRAARFAKTLCESLTPAEQIAAAALPPHIKRHSPRGGFSYRFPELIEVRHAEFLPAAEDGSFGTLARRLGRTFNDAKHLRCEFIYMMLARGEAPAFAIVDARHRYPRKNEGLILAGAFPVIWENHETALIEAEARGIRRVESKELRSRRATLATQLFEAMTSAKVTQSHAAARDLLKMCGLLIDDFEHEEKSR